jgi:hypothetical protein
MFGVKRTGYPSVLKEVAERIPLRVFIREKPSNGWNRKTKNTSSP